MDCLAWRGAGRDPLALAVVVGQDLAVAALVIVDSHSLGALAADDEALQQRWTFAGGRGAALLAAGGGVRLKRLLVSLVLLEADVSGVRIADQDSPLVLRLVDGSRAAVDVGELFASPVEVRAGVARVVQREQHQIVAQLLSVDLAGVRSSVGVSAGEAQLLGGELL